MASPSPVDRMAARAVAVAAGAVGTAVVAAVALADAVRRRSRPPAPEHPAHRRG